MGGVISRKITGADGMYVRGVAVVASVDIDRSILLINNNPERLVVFALFASCSTQYSAALRCW